jgi:hypothetical protein
MKTVTLRHKRAIATPYQLDHATYCAAMGACECTQLQVPAVKRVGQFTGIELRDVSAPPVLTLFAGEERHGVPEAVLESRAIKAAVERRWIIVTPKTEG